MRADERASKLVANAFQAGALTVSNGVNSSGPCIAFLSGPLQIFSIYHKDLKTMSKTRRVNLW